ncbi:MAG: PIN domain-containing protein [Opitutaceae bacterium]|nr:PIN domain-containing protein [Opitutaceae bacterium]
MPPQNDWLDTVLLAAETITPRTGTRTLDIIHIALARHHEASHFISFDHNQRKAAAAAGFLLTPATL